MNRAVRVALAGVGSCASSLVQAVTLATRTDHPMAGIMYHEIDGYGLADVEFVLAFDVDRNKVGVDLAKAIVVPPTAALTHVDVQPQHTLVEAGPLLDGLDGPLGDVIDAHPDSRTAGIDILVRRLRETDTDVLVCLLPTGSTAAVQTYARAAGLAGAGFVNATPEPVAHDESLVALFERQRTPLLGDDLRSHLGATTLHTALIELLASHALRVTNTYQLNIGGNTDFLNLSDPVRAASKVRSKRTALAAAGIASETVSAGPSGYVPYLGDTKTCFVRIEATSVLDTPVVLDVRMEVEDSPNAVGVLSNAVRVAKAARDRSHGGVVDDVGPFLFKKPRRGASASEGHRMFTEFVHRLSSAAP